MCHIIVPLVESFYQLAHPLNPAENGYPYHDQTEVVDVNSVKLHSRRCMLCTELKGALE